MTMIGKKILHYKILEKLGEGGMGIVYKGEDTKLNRNVAIKLLPSHLLVSNDDHSRFKREAKAAAALNHANIATVYEINEYEGTPLIVMEYVEGQTLNHHIAKGPFKLQDAILVAIQIAQGLKTAHAKDIVHRDIKSSNVVLGPDKQAKILDFGLAKTSMSTKLTQMGSTIGTVAYMSPEQVDGQEVDQRTDLWSLGIVLYEMISGHLPFRAEYNQAIFFAILNEQPKALTSIRTDVPMSLEWIVSKLLAKNPDERYQNAGDLIIDLKAVDVKTSGFTRITQEAVTSLKPPPSEMKRSSWLPWIIASITSLLFMLMILLYFIKPSHLKRDAQHFNVSAVYSETQDVLRTDVQVMALSPDGEYLVYCMSDAGKSYLYLRPLNSFEAHPIEGTSNATGPFFSPDGQWIGFNADGKIKKVSIKGGAVEILADAPGFRGGSWGTDGYIIFSPSYSAGLVSVSATGGTPKVISVPDTSNNERTHRWPQVLPDGEHVIYTIGDVDNPNAYDNAQIAIQSLKSGERQILDVRGEMAWYIEAGYLVVARKGVLLTAPFDIEERKFLAPLVTVLEDIDGDNGSGISFFGISRKGDIAYIQGTRNQELELVWVDLDGNIEPIPLPLKPYQIPRVSPDGTKIAVNLGFLGQADDIWLYDLSTAVFNRFTFGKGIFCPVWSKNSANLYFASIQGGIMQKSLSGGESETITNVGSNIAHYPITISPDNKYLILNQLGGVNEGELMMLDLYHPDRLEFLFSSDAYEYGGDFSPDGKYFSYGSNETGRLEIYIKSFPDLKSKWQVSTEGGLSPRWSPDCKKLYYINNVGKMMMVPIKREPFFSPGKPRVLFDVSQMYFPNNPVSNYDISPDGKRFIMVKNISFQTNIMAFNFITNWIAALNKSFMEKI
jgi:serine/threonine protein kinase